MQIKPEKDSLMKVLKEFAWEFVNLGFFHLPSIAVSSGPQEQERKRTHGPLRPMACKQVFWKTTYSLPKYPKSNDKHAKMLVFFQ